MNDRYLHYTLEEFLTDDAFINYANGNDSEIEILWNDWLKSHHEQGIVCKNAKSMLLGLQFNEEEISMEKSNSIWANIQNKTNTSSSTKTTKIISLATGYRNWKNIAIGLAACIALFALVNNWEHTETLNEYNNSTANIELITLPDQSIVSLNKNSSISYNEKNWTTNRSLNLNGEAFFKVLKGEKFAVHTDNVIVQVLGTSFNVYDRDDILNVSCNTGSVMVIKRYSNDTIILSPGDGVRMIHKDILRPYHFDINNANSTNANIISYEQQSLITVFEELEMMYDVDIEFNSTISNQLYTGQVKLGTLDQILHHICWPMHLKYHINGQKVNITK